MRRQPIFERRRLNRPRLGGPDAGRAPSLMPFGNEAARPSVLTVTPVRSGRTLMSVSPSKCQDHAGSSRLGGADTEGATVPGDDVVNDG
jgi:hypothetical protein